MKHRLPIFDVGFELEFFLYTNSGCIENANKTMTELLGFCIDQNNPGAGKLGLGGGYDLRTDGTAMELQWYRPGNGGVVPTNIQGTISSVKALRPFKPLFASYLKEGKSEWFPGECELHPTSFIDPGKVYSSGKVLHDAYKNTYRFAEKKDGVADVTSRTAGLHLHFSVHHNDKLSNQVFQTSQSWTCREHTNMLVQTLDSLWDDYYSQGSSAYYGADTKKRLETYQNRGEYRVKLDTVSGNPTLEYRMLDAYQCKDLARLQKFIDGFQLLAARYINSL